MAFIGVDRDIENHWIYQDAEYFKVWFEILLRTRYSHEPERKLIEGTFIDIEYGEFIFGRISWAKRLGISERRLRTLFDKLVADGMIVLKTRATKFSKYFVVNYEKYNKIDQQTDQQGIPPVVGESGTSDQQSDQQPTSSRPAADHTITKKQSNKVTNKDPKTYYAEFVSLSEKEYTTLVTDLGLDFVQKCIVTLDNYKGSKGTKYKSDYRAILNWVIDRVREDERKLRVINGGGANASQSVGQQRGYRGFEGKGSNPEFPDDELDFIQGKRTQVQGV